MLVGVISKYDAPLSSLCSVDNINKYSWKNKNETSFSIVVAEMKRNKKERNISVFTSL